MVQLNLSMPGTFVGRSTRPGLLLSDLLALTAPSHLQSPSFNTFFLGYAVAKSSDGCRISLCPASLPARKADQPCG